MLGAGRASALVGRVNDDAVHTLAVPIAGAGIVVIGSLLLTVGVWRAGTVPKWFLVLSAATSIAAFVVPPSSAAGLVVEGVSSLTTIAIGWYAWRLYALRGTSAATPEMSPCPAGARQRPAAAASAVELRRGPAAAGAARGTRIGWRWRRPPPTPRLGGARERGRQRDAPLMLIELA